MRSVLRSLRAIGPGSLALVLGLVGLGLPVHLAPAAELRATATARIEQLAGVTFVGSESNAGARDVGAAGEAARLSPAALDGSAEPVAGELTITAAPRTAISLTFAVAPLDDPGAAVGPALLVHDAGSQPATDAAGRLTVRLGAAAQPQFAAADGGIAQVIVNY